MQNLIGFLISALGIVVSIYLYLIAQKYRQIAYTLQCTDISLKNILNTNESVFPYKEQSFSVTDMIIWCKGRVLIDNNDFAPSCPLKISISGENKILNYQITTINEPANNFWLSATDNDITIGFDYLNHKNGIALRVIHTGSRQNISVGCKLKDGKKLLFVCHRKGELCLILLQAIRFTGLLICLHTGILKLLNFSAEFLDFCLLVGKFRFIAGNLSFLRFHSSFHSYYVVFFILFGR